jgi:crotonobetainyl-CoA:carnitine CoA-transferase CaiB-like acyl-CoA transferase
MTDLATGLYAHGAIMAALLERQRTGQGQKIDCNLLSTQVDFGLFAMNDQWPVLIRWFAPRGEL